MRETLITDPVPEDDGKKCVPVESLNESTPVFEVAFVVFLFCMLLCAFASPRLFTPVEEQPKVVALHELGPWLRSAWFKW